MIVGVVGYFALHSIALPVYVKATLLLALCMAAMVIVEIAVHGLLSRNGLLAPRPSNWPRVLKKLIGLWITLGVIFAAYWLIPVYSDEYYRPFWNALYVVGPLLILLSPIYVWYVDARDPFPDDAYVEIAHLAIGVFPKDWNAVLQHVRGWLVKAFFLPLMFVFVHSDLSRFWGSELLLPTLPNFEAVFSYAYDALFLIDVLIACIGYLLTLRLLGAHIKSAEPTLLGWLVCLACYPPFWGMTSNYFSYDQDGTYWGALMASNPILYTCWGTVILALVGVYVWATLSFGIRFSNLTNRGIITHGPYRWVKHPAYLAKNITWWMISVPFVAGTGDIGMAVRSCVLLACVNVLYLLRARTEERHLAADPAYRAYQAFIAEHGLAAVLRRMAMGRPAVAGSTHL